MKRRVPGGDLLLIKDARLICPESDFDCTADVLVEGESIVNISKGIKPASFCAVLEGEGLVLCPSFVDMHVHLREPGDEHKETLGTGLRAAAAGGFTAVMCMPNTVPSIDNPEIAVSLQKRAEALGLCNLLICAAMTTGREGKELTEMKMLKSCDSNVIAVSDDGCSVRSSSTMKKVIQYADSADLLPVCHCEDADLTEYGIVNESAFGTRLGLRPHSSVAESIAAARDMLLALSCGAKIHITHVSSIITLKLIEFMKGLGLSVTTDATPHHIFLDESELCRYETVYKVNPPLRSPEDRHALLEAVVSGGVEVIASDHAPHAAFEKETDIEEAPFGIEGLETAFSVVHTAFLSVLQETDAIRTAIERMSKGPRDVLGIGKPVFGGVLQKGFPADMAIIDTKRSWTPSVDDIESKSKNNPFIGRMLRGKVEGTIIKGKFSFFSENLNGRIKQGKPIFAID